MSTLMTPQKRNGDRRQINRLTCKTTSISIKYAAQHDSRSSDFENMKNTFKIGFLI